MDGLRSIRSFSRARTNSQRGFALIAAIALSILYFALIELMLLESSRELSEAQRFRSRIVATTLAEARRFRAKIIAATLAENGAELAAADLVTRFGANVNATDWQGTISGNMRKTRGPVNEGDRIVIIGTGTATGIVETSARVELTGRVTGAKVKIDYAVHTP